MPILAWQSGTEIVRERASDSERKREWLSGEQREKQRGRGWDVTYGDGGRVWNVRERKGEGGLHLRAQLESLVSAAVATTLPQRNMDLLFSLCSAAHFPPKSPLKLFQFRTRDVRRRLPLMKK
ncbi:hypothetical protein DVH24_041895 [Malus domestica]|uniref:Uncharacterized protein n=1 Tax=Malus domestica TaxID=3750 RepID=A0A498ISQ9_MALDO|nr:hypothetical protein DVH24_041895 [Malus domestica]